MGNFGEFPLQPLSVHIRVAGAVQSIFLLHYGNSFVIKFVPIATGQTLQIKMPLINCHLIVFYIIKQGHEFLLLGGQHLVESLGRQFIHGFIRTMEPSFGQIFARNQQGFIKSDRANINYSFSTCLIYVGFCGGIPG
jgi:hypothetical protein